MIRWALGPLATLLLLHVSLRAEAGGAASFRDDVLPLLESQPELIDPLLRGYEVSDPGEGLRIGWQTCPALAGKVVSPYRFRAHDREAPYKEVALLVNMDVDFYDPEGHIVYQIRDGIPDDDDHALYRAVRVEQRPKSVAIRKSSGVGPE